MTHDSTDHHAEKPTQGVFIGWVAVGLLCLMAVFSLVVIGAGASMGFS